MTEKTDQVLERALTIARTALRFGEVKRVTRHEDGATRESDTSLDSSVAAQFAVVHDLAETYAAAASAVRARDVSVSPAKEEREQAAMRRLSEEFGDTSKVIKALCVYEAQRSSEARLVRYLDKVLPKLTHYLNGGAALVSLGITAGQMRLEHSRQGARLREQYPELPEVGRLFAAACKLVERGVESGEVRVAPESEATTALAEAAR